jgi:hypothetical protein
MTDKSSTFDTDSLLKWGRALRLTFSYSGTEIKLINEQNIESRIPPSDDLNEHEERSGFWYELRDKDGRTLYRKAIYNPISYDAEFLSERERGKFSRKKIPNPAGAFAIMVPDTPHGRTLVMFSSPFNPEESFKAAKEFACFELMQQQENQREDEK